MFNYFPISYMGQTLSFSLENISNKINYLQGERYPEQGSYDRVRPDTDVIPLLRGVSSVRIATLIARVVEN